MRPIRDGRRLALALLFGLVFALTVAITLGIAAWGTSEARTTINGLLPVLLPAELTLLGAAAAFLLHRRGPEAEGLSDRGLAQSLIPPGRSPAPSS